MDYYRPYAMQGLENTLENELDRHIKIKQSFSKQNVFPSLIFLHDCQLQLLDSNIMQKKCAPISQSQQKHLHQYNKFMYEAYKILFI